MTTKMNSQKEATFQRQVVEFLHRRDAFIFNTIGNAYQRFVPDLFVAHRHWTGWLELKISSGRLSKGQLYVLTQLRQRGVDAYVLRSMKDGLRLEIETEVGAADYAYSSMEQVWEFLCTK